MIKNVIFDMGNVLLTYDPQVPLDAYCPDAESKALIRKVLFDGPEWQRRDKGDLTAAEQYEILKEKVPAEYHEALRRCVFEWMICMQPIPATVELVHSLKARGYHCYVISNAGVEFHDYFRRFGDISVFDGILVSCDVHLLKPSGEIFEHAVRAWGIEPAESLFVDDLPGNVEGARAAGLNAVLFTGDTAVVEAELR